MQLKIAYSVNAATVSLEKARAYAEEAFKKAGQDLDKVLPNFDKNYMVLQRQCKKAMNVPRIQMPVIEPSDINQFAKDIQKGRVDIFAPYAKGKFKFPESAKDEEWIGLGYADGSKTDDVIRGNIKSIPVGKLVPTQSQIWLDKMIGNIIKFGPVKSGSPVLSLTIIVSKEGYILDGHHRYGQATLCDPGLKMKSLFVPLPIKELLEVGRAYGDWLGNSRKGSYRERLAAWFDFDHQ